MNQPGRRNWVAAILSAGLALAAQGLPYVTGHYAKQEVMLPMRDGVRLYTAIYSPREPRRPCPILLERTPYGSGPYGPDSYKADLGPSARFGREGFIFVYQDVRGQMMSEGSFTDLTPARPHPPAASGVDESTDTCDTVAWLLEHVPGHNCRVGQWGGQLPGLLRRGRDDRRPSGAEGGFAPGPHHGLVRWGRFPPQRRPLAGPPVHLQRRFQPAADGTRPRRAPAPVQVPRDGYGFFLGLGPLANVDRRYFKGSVPLWDEVMAHGARDAYWQARDLRPHLRAVAPAVLGVGGWFDAENLFGTLELHRTLAAQSPATDQHLVLGPWDHGGWHQGAGDQLGDLAFGDPTSEWFQAEVEFPFFLHHLKGGPDPGLPPVWAFETGSNRWRRLAAWPPAGARPRNLYFGAHGRLAWRPPAVAGADAYPSDPARPVPYYEGITPGMARDYMTADQRFAGRRPDVLVYATGPLEAERTLAGPVQAELWVSTTGTDSDWVVKLIDGYPDEGPAPRPGGRALNGYQQLVRGAVLRGKFRRSLEAPEPMVPGQPTRISLRLDDVFHTFRRGHRIMVQVQSSWFPLVDRNPQVFTDIYHASEADFRAAGQRLHRGPALPSHLVLPVLP